MSVGRQGGGRGGSPLSQGAVVTRLIRFLNYVVNGIWRYFKGVRIGMMPKSWCQIPWSTGMWITNCGGVGSPLHLEWLSFRAEDKSLERTSALCDQDLDRWDNVGGDYQPMDGVTEEEGEACELRLDCDIWNLLSQLMDPFLIHKLFTFKGAKQTNWSSIKHQEMETSKKQSPPLLTRDYLAPVTLTDAKVQEKHSSSLFN